MAAEEALFCGIRFRAIVTDVGDLLSLLLLSNLHPAQAKDHI